MSAIDETWRLDEDGDIVSTEGRRVAYTGRAYGAREATLAQASSYIIAAAPELYRALEYLVTCDVYETKHAREVALAALRKARGGT